MKKLTSIILVMTIIITLASPTFASKIYINETESPKIFIYNGHGEYVVTNEESLAENYNLNISILKVGDKISALPTTDEEFFKIQNSDKYLVLATNNKYLLCDKINIDIQNFENNINTFEQYNISDYLKEDIEKVIAEQKLLCNNAFKIELYAPSMSVSESDASVMANEPLGRQYYTYYYDGMYNNMMDYSVKYSNLNTGMIRKSGVSTINTAKNFVSLVVSSIGGVSEIVNVFGTYLGIAMSAYDVFKSIRGEVLQGTANDYISTNLIYSRIVKETYAQDPVYNDYPNAGCVSHKVWLDHNETYHYYQSKGEGELTTSSLNKEIYTENFRNPAPIAIDNGISATHFDFPLMTTLYGTTINLVGSY